MENRYAKFFPLENSLGFIIYRTALEMKTALQRAFRRKGFDITAEQWGILLTLWEKDGVSQQDIAARTYKNKANITRYIDALEEKGILARKADPADRRKYYIFLTEKGRNLRPELMPIALDALKAATGDLKKNEMEDIKCALNRIYENCAEKNSRPEEE